MRENSAEVMKLVQENDVPISELDLSARAYNLLMLNYVLAKEDLLSAVAQIQEKKDLSGHVGADYYEPGKMENLDQYLGVYDENTKTITLRTESKGLRYEERTPRLDYRSVGDPVQLVREPTNSFNSNNIMILSDSGESLGNLSADLCNVISPLLDLGYLTIHDAHITYIERIRERSRYARQGVLFIQFQVQLHGI